jgi:hypothetical protein
MAKKSKNYGKKISTEIKVDAGIKTQRPTVSVENLSVHFEPDHVSISLRYYQMNCECFSEWEKHELKKFSNTAKKINGYSPTLLKRTLSLCDIHKGDPSEARLSAAHSPTSLLSWSAARTVPRSDGCQA